jgi:hypothetical protein
MTRVLNQIEDGDPTAADQLLSLVYDELKRLAAHKMAREYRIAIDFFQNHDFLRHNSCENTALCNRRD